jgi:shikimate kinase
MDPLRNVVLIGMPGAGKSTVGVLLAKALSREFLDTDLLIQAREGRRLQAILEELGAAAFRALEERYLVELRCRGAVIATGGSAVYSAKAMAHLGTGGTLVYLELPLPHLQRRLGDAGQRGIVRAPGQTLAQLDAERRPLYERYADRTVHTLGLDHEQVVAAILAALDQRA